MARAALLLTALLVLALAPAADARPGCGGKKATIVGTGGPDVLRGHTGPDVIAGLGGDDKIVAGKGLDVVCGGDGNDTIDAGPNVDRIVAGLGDDVVYGASGSDKLAGGEGADSLYGGQGGEVARGGAGDDRLFGALQDDSLIGGEGNDLLVGNQGSDDLFGEEGEDWLRGDTERDEYDGGSGDDWVSFAAATPPAREADEGGVILTLSPGTVRGDDASEPVARIENVVGSAFHDSITGAFPPGPGGTVVGLANPGDECLGFLTTRCGIDPRAGAEAVVFADPNPRDPGLVVLGGPGADAWRISTAGTRTTITATSDLATGPGCEPAEQNDRIVTCTAPAELGYLVAYGDHGDDRIAIDSDHHPGATFKLDGGRGNDVLEGGPGGEILEAGGPGSDARHAAGFDNDILRGNDGDDALFTRPGGDQVDGGPGGDQLAADDVCGGHVFDGGPGRLDIMGFDPVNPVLSRRRGSARPGIVARVGGRVEYRHAGCDEPGRILSTIEILEGSQLNDVLVGDGGKDALILGGDGDDVLKGRAGPDGLRGELGSDVLLGGPGHDDLQAADGQKDRHIHCGPGGGSAVTDRRDPRPLGCGRR